MWWFGREIPALHPLPACPYSQLPPAEQGSLEMLRFAWSNSIFASNSVQSQILHFRGWSKVGTHPGGVWSCSAPNWEIKEGKSEEKGGEGSWGNLSTQFLWSVLNPSWSCVSSSQPTASSKLPPDLVQTLPLEGLVWNCSPWEQGIVAAECVWVLGSPWWGNVSEGEQDLKDSKGRNSPFWTKGEPLHPKICHQRQGRVLKHFLHEFQQNIWGSDRGSKHPLVQGRGVNLAFRDCSFREFSGELSLWSRDGKGFQAPLGATCEIDPNSPGTMIDASVNLLHTSFTECFREIHLISANSG